MDVVDELKQLRDMIRQSVERVEGAKLDRASEAELSNRKKMMAQIEEDIRRMEDRLNA